MAHPSRGLSPLKPRALLHIEICIKVTESHGTSKSEEELANEVCIWLQQNHPSIVMNEIISSFTGLQHAENIRSIQITDVTGLSNEEPVIGLENVELDAKVFGLFGDEDPTQLIDRTTIEDGDQCAQAKITRLPSANLQGIWDSLVFEKLIQVKLLRFIMRMMTLTSRQLDSRTVGWNRLILLWGPPGTGKTSLCRALAQKVSIRLKGQYNQTKLIEIDSHSMFSRYFSESSGLVGKLFEALESLLDKEKDTFVILLIDEMESLVSARDKNLDSNEPRDAMRAVNTLLTCLDRLCASRKNVLVLSTSNLIQAMDNAFLDRVDMKQYIPNPSAKARYEVYRRCYLELALCGIIAPVHHYEDGDTCMVEGEPECGSPSNVTFQSRCHVLDKEVMPEFELMQLRYWSDPDSPARKLWSIAENSKDLSGRTLRRLPTLALALYTTIDPCPIEEALRALSCAVNDELQAKNSSSGRVDVV